MPTVTRAQAVIAAANALRDVLDQTPVYGTYNIARCDIDRREDAYRALRDALSLPPEAAAPVAWVVKGAVEGYYWWTLSGRIESPRKYCDDWNAGEFVTGKPYTLVPLSPPPDTTPVPPPREGG